MTDIVVNRYNLYLKSSQRTQGTNEHPIYILRRPLFKTNPFNVFEVSIKQTLIPYSFFSVNSNKGNLPNGNAGTLQFNQFQWYLARGGATYPSTTYVVGSPANPITTTIPQGNYTILSLITAIQLAMKDYLTYYYPTYGNPNWSWTYNRDTLLINFLLNGSDGITTTFYIIPSTVVDGGLSFNMGITSLINFGYNASNQSQPITYIGVQSFTGAFSQSSINVSPITSLMIRSNNLIQNRSYEFVAISDDFSDIILRVPIQTVGTTLINYDNQANIRNRIKNEYIDIIDFYISDNRTYDTVSLNGLDWMAVLEVTELEIHENKVNEAHNMLKDVNFAKHEISDSVPLRRLLKNLPSAEEPPEQES